MRTQNTTLSQFRSWKTRPSSSEASEQICRSLTASSRQRRSSPQATSARSGSAARKRYTGRRGHKRPQHYSPSSKLSTRQPQGVAGTKLDSRASVRPSCPTLSCSCRLPGVVLFPILHHLPVSLQGLVPVLHPPGG